MSRLSKRWPVYWTPAKDSIIISKEIDCQAITIHSQYLSSGGGRRLLILFVLVDPMSFIHYKKLGILFLNGLFQHISCGWMIFVQPPETITKSIFFWKRFVLVSSVMWQRKLSHTKGHLLNISQPRTSSINEVVSSWFIQVVPANANKREFLKLLILSKAASYWATRTVLIFSISKSW